MNNNVKALKSGIWYTISNFFVKSIGFLTTPLFTRLLTKSDFGLYNNYTSWLAIAIILVTLNLESTLISARYDFEREFDKYIFSILGLSTSSTVFWLIIVNVFSGFFENILGLKLVYINVMLVYLLFFPAVNLFQARERYMFEYKKTVLTSLILSVGTAFFSVMLVVFCQNKLTGRIIGAVLPTIFLGVGFYVFFAIKSKKMTMKYWRYALPISIPYIPHLLSLTLLNSTDRIMINRWCGAEDVAMYSLAYMCGSIVTLLITSFNSAFAPWLGEKLSENKVKEIRKVSKIYMLAFFLFSIGIMLISPEILIILGGKNYQSAIYVMTPVAMGCVCQFLYTLLVNVEQFKKKTIGMAIASLSAAAINVILNWIFIPRYGYLAAAYTTLVGYICLLLMHMFLVYKLKLSVVYNYKYIGVLVITGLIIMVLITWLYSSNIIRLIVIVIYSLILIVIGYKYRNMFRSLVKKTK